MTATLLAAWLITIDLIPHFPWHQRFFPLALYFFLIGMLAHRFYNWARPNDLLLQWSAFIAAIICVAFLHHSQTFGGWTPGNALIFTGLLAAGLPFIFALTRDWQADQMIGDFSYPLYLTHYIAMQSIPFARDSLILAFVAALVTAAPLVFLVDRPIDRWRHALVFSDRRIRATAGFLP